MIHEEAVSGPLLRLLRQFMGDPGLADFHLAGGTSLALRFGHRESIDIDLFTDRPFGARELADRLRAGYGLAEAETGKNTVRGLVDGIKVDLIAHRYPLLEQVDVLGGIRIFSLPDVAAMKLNAIADRGSKKDFWDYDELLKHFARDEMLQFCRRKYSGDSVWNIEKSLCYFDDAELEPDPRDLRGESWEDVKRRVADANRL